jgi:cell division protein FtsA
MVKSKLVAAIDLGSSKISTIVGQVNSDPMIGDTTINIVGVSSVESKGVRTGQIVDIEEAVEAMVASVEGAERMAGFNLESAYVSLGGGRVASQNSHGVVAVTDPQGEIGAEDVDRVVEAASAISLPSSREVIHVIPREFMVDGENGVKDPVGMSGIRLEVETHLVTASASAVKNLKKAVNEVGVSIPELVFTGVAASEAVLTKTEKELGCIVIDIGGGTTSIAAFVDGALCFSSVIPIGAKNITNDLAIGLRVSIETAEKIKIALSKLEHQVRKPVDKDDKKTDKKDDDIELSDLGVEENKKVSRKTLVEGIVRPRLNEIFGIVKMQLDKESLLSRTPSGVVLTGGGAETVGIVDSAKRVLGLPVRVGVPYGLGGLIDDVMNPSYAVALGLIKHAAAQDQATVNVSSSSMSKKMKLPQSGIAGKLIQAVKDLLP